MGVGKCVKNIKRLNMSKGLFKNKEISSNLSAHQEAVNHHIQHLKRDYGIFFTPEKIVNFMVNLIDPNEYANQKSVVVLEPACGLAQFLIGIKRNQPSLFKKTKMFGVEINQDIIRYLKSLKLENEFKLINQDYLLWESEPIFDLIIGNPPYGIPSLSSHYTIKVDPKTKEKYKERFETWYGKYNIYGSFIEKSIKLLKTDGRLIFIVPATFMILDEFKKLRKFLASNGRTNLIYLGPDVFKPEADVASVILDFRKSNQYTSLLILQEFKNHKISEIKVNQSWKGEVIKFETDYTRNLEKICSYYLKDIFEITISPRTSEIKNNPLVLKEKPLNNGYLPLLNGRNLKCHKIIYENFTGYWIKRSNLKTLRGYFGAPHFVVGLGFRENGKIATAYDAKCYPWMGDIYHLLRRTNLFYSDFDLAEQEILEYLNSDYLRKYVKDTYREITYHLSITQLKNLPLPTKKEWQEIRRNISYERAN